MPLRHEAPNPALMQELEQVSADAEAVLAALGSVNALPEDFPDLEITELCQSLRDLKDGTDEGCRSQLELARNCIGDWCLIHFHPEDEEAPESEDVVRLYRDMHLDQRLGRLLQSVGRGLAAYRRQVSDHFDDTVVAEETFTAEGDPGAAAVKEQTVAVEAQIGAAKSEIEQRLDAKKPRVDLLQRRLTDGANLARTARSELRARPIVRRWYNGVVEALEKTPELIIAAGNALQVGADVGQSVAEWWATFKKDPIRAIATAIRTLGKALVELGERQAKRRDGRRDATRLESFPDTPFAPEMVVLPAGSFQMGSPEGEAGRSKSEGPRRHVMIAGFAIGRYPVTFAEYDHFCEVTGRTRPKALVRGRGRSPVTKVSWHDAVAYTAWLSEQTGKAYRLPSEAEWEYACRAGTTTAYWWGNDFDACKANVMGGRSRKTVFSFGLDISTPTTEVGSNAANPWGLVDILGNTWEWVEDHFHDTYKGAPNDGRAWVAELVQQNRPRVLRGGSRKHGPKDARCANRDWAPPNYRSDDVGFRVVCSSPS